MRTLYVALLCAAASTATWAAERQRSFDNSDIERVMRENPGLAIPPSAPRANTVYRCKKLSTEIIWADRPCHTIDASTTDVYHVPANMDFNERVRHAQAQYRERYPTPTVQALGPTAQQKYEECNKLKADLFALWRRHKNTDTYLALSKPLKQRQAQLGCD